MQVTLNQNGWHRRLQLRVFNDPPLFENLCPYFWLTMFCLVAILPLTLLRFSFHVVVWPCSKLWDGFTFVADAIGKVITALLGNLREKRELTAKEKMARLLKKMSDYDLYRHMMIYDDHAYTFAAWEWEESMKIFRAWREQFAEQDEVENRMKALREKYHERWEKELADIQDRYLKKNQASMQRRKNFYKIAEWTKWGFSASGIALGVAGIVFGVVKFVLLCIASPQVFPITVIALLSVAIVCFLVYRFGKTTFGVLSMGVEKVGDGVAGGVGLFGQFFMATKNKLCPHIEWKKSEADPVPVAE